MDDELMENWSQEEALQQDIRRNFYADMAASAWSKEAISESIPVAPPLTSHAIAWIPYAPPQVQYRFTPPPYAPSFHKCAPQAISFPLDKNKSIDRIAHKIMVNESISNDINWNDNNAGISAGVFQANQKYGELPILLHRMKTKDPDLFVNIFGEDFARLVDKNKDELRKISFTNISKTGPNELGSKLKEAIKEPIFAQVQIDMLRQKITYAAKVAAEYGIKSEKGVALVADMINQLGEGNRKTGARQYLQYALHTSEEEDKLKTISEHCSFSLDRVHRNQIILSDQSLRTDLF